MQIFWWKSKRLTFCLLLSTFHLINAGLINVDEHKSENFYGIRPSGVKELVISLAALDEIFIQDWLNTINSKWINSTNSVVIYDNTDDSEVLPMYMSKFVKQMASSIETIFSMFEQFDIDLDMPF